ncbi:helix-turn-helix domain-containing protein [Streptomyces purpurogeneiscleroticus]|uniref:helix-turn-helix domain-containing protein n=1 Tax=Streptomyces purpurogeneiscleroticus TaxID=68259 RepID=UPI001CBD0BA7|nr:pyridoxamine 5'-phosphate oxidase family protein [Streptomyces purpurogeneiscleroticus]MBZ4019649.1 DNA-binding protein [Streptomyces purpurogeneiscleroticus]
MENHETGARYGPGMDRSDLGRRATLRRQQLGLTREQVAARAGAAPGYLQFVEEGSAMPDIAFMLRLAHALETSVADLAGGTGELPPGLGMAGTHPEVWELSDDECRARLGTHGVGRVAVTVGGVPGIFPVNYTVAGDLIAYRTAPGSGPAAAAGHETALEVDHIDEAFSQGWSVLVVGTAHLVTDADEARALDERAYTTPWAGEGRDQWIVIRPARITGRRIRVQGGGSSSESRRSRSNG